MQQKQKQDCLNSLDNERNATNSCEC